MAFRRTFLQRFTKDFFPTRFKKKGQRKKEKGLCTSANTVWPPDAKSQHNFIFYKNVLRNLRPKIAGGILRNPGPGFKQCRNGRACRKKGDVRLLWDRCIQVQPRGHHFNLFSRLCQRPVVPGEPAHLIHSLQRAFTTLVCSAPNLHCQVNNPIFILRGRERKRTCVNHTHDQIYFL